MGGKKQKYDSLNVILRVQIVCTGEVKQRLVATLPGCCQIFKEHNRADCAKSAPCSLHSISVASYCGQAAIKEEQQGMAAQWGKKKGGVGAKRCLCRTVQ